MRILITGITGLLGSDLATILCPHHDVYGVARHLPEKPVSNCHFIQGDLLNSTFIRTMIREIKPDMIIHAAAMTHVDQCEIHPEDAFTYNTEMTLQIALAASDINAFLLFFSTDYVFDGLKKSPYLESDPIYPINHYGKSKAQAEAALLSMPSLRFVIFRITWLYGIQGRSFPKTILEKALVNSFLSVVEDQIGRPTYSRDLAFFILKLLNDPEKNMAIMNREIFHLGNEGWGSWADFAELLLSQAGRKAKVQRITSDKLDRPAKRPAYSVLSIDKAKLKLQYEPRSWQDACSEFVAEYLAG